MNDQFYLAMERATPENIQMWRDYAKRQSSDALRKWATIQKFLPCHNGSSSFASAISCYGSFQNYFKIFNGFTSDNELWIAYASDTHIKEMAEHIEQQGMSNHIEMYVAVITSPNALIEYHAGISRTVEAAEALQKTQPTKIKQADQSTRLHSFAAKVMKLREPKKVYMATLPADMAVTNILLKKMPAASVFIGDNFYQQKIDKMSQEVEAQLAENPLLKKYYSHDSRIDQLKANPPRIVFAFDENCKNGTCTIQKPDGTTLISFDKTTADYQGLANFIIGDHDSIVGDSPKLLPYILVDLDKLAAVSTLASESTSHTNEQIINTNNINVSNK